jgi:drug/metabolite transporter (DMT)-like permease
MTGTPVLGPPLADPEALTAQDGLLGGLVLTACSAVGFGLYGIFARVAYDNGANVVAVLATRSVLLVPLVFLFLSERRRRAAWRGRRVLVAMTLLSMFNVTTYAVALDQMSPALVSLIIYAYPALVVGVAHVLGWSPLNALSVMAGILVLSGVALTIGFPAEELDVFGVVIAFISACGYGSYLLVTQVAMRATDPVTCLAFVMGGSSLALALGTLAFFEVEFPTGTAGVVSIVSVAAVATLLPMLLLFAGIRRIGSAWASMISCLELVTAVVASVVFLSTPLTPGMIVGSVLVLLGALALPLAALERSQSSERVS